MHIKPSPNIHPLPQFSAQIDTYICITKLTKLNRNNTNFIYFLIWKRNTVIKYIIFFTLWFNISYRIPEKKTTLIEPSIYFAIIFMLTGLLQRFQERHTYETENKGTYKPLQKIGLKCTYPGLSNIIHLHYVGFRHQANGSVHFSYPPAKFIVLLIENNTQY